MMLPVEVRIVPTFQVIASFAWLNTFAGLTLPLMASATATFLFRQFFKTVPKELVDAAKLDGAGPLRFFRRSFTLIQDTDSCFVYYSFCIWLEPISLAVGYYHRH